MEALCAALGNPQDDYATLHVVGTNGKTSVTLMAAALLEASGLRAGACISPHAWRWSERTRIRGEEIAAGEFAAATEEVAAAARGIEVTQFEAAIAASFVAFRRAGVEAAVVEAGLGGRLDATNVIHSRATALTSVGLDHTEWLGETEAEIAAEKLAVLEPGTTLVIGSLDPKIEAQARAAAEAAGAELVKAPDAEPAALPDGMAGTPYLRRNASVAFALAAQLAPPPDPAAARAALGSLALSGRAEMIGGDPPLIADAAHNVAGAAALAEALPALAGGRPVFAAVSILGDKDAGGFARALAPALTGVVCTAADPGPAMGRPGARALEPELLAGHFRTAGVRAEPMPDPEAAIARAIALAQAEKGVALCAGSHYLLRYAWTVKHAQSSSR